MNFKLADWLFFSSLLVTRLADQIVLFMVPFIVFQLTGSAAISGIAFFLETLPRFLSFPIAGVLCDHISPYKVISVSQKTRFLIIPLGLLGNYFSESIYWLITISAFTGVATSFGVIAREVIIPQAFKSVRLAKTMSFTSLSDQLGIVAGPILAVSLLALLDWETVLMIGALLFVLSDLLIHVWKSATETEIKALNKGRIELIHSMSKACRHIRQLHGLLPAVVLAFSVNLILGTTLATVVPIYTGTFEQGSFSYGVLQAISALGSISVLLVIARFAMGLKLLATLGFVAIAVGAMMTALANHYVVYFLGFALIITFDKMFSIFVRSLRVKVIPPDELGKTTGLIVLLNNISQPLAGLLVALLAAVIALQELVLYLNLTAILIGVLTLLIAVLRGGGR